MSKALSKAEFAELESRVKDSAAGPWVLGRNRDDSGWLIISSEIDPLVAWIRTGFGNDGPHPNADLIAAAPSLLATVRARDVEVEALREALAGIMEYVEGKGSAIVAG